RGAPSCARSAGGRSRRPSVADALLRERHEHRNARLRPHLARAVPLPRRILRDEDVTHAEALHRAVADLDVDGAGEREDRVTSGRVMPRVGALRVEAADDDAAAWNQLGRLGLITTRLELRRDLLEMRLAVSASVDANDRHDRLPLNETHHRAAS